MDNRALLGYFLVMLIAVVLDLLVGEARRWHPLVGFGRAAAWLELKLNFPLVFLGGQRGTGVLALILLVAPPVVGVIWLSGFSPWLALGLEVYVLYWALGSKSLYQHATAVTRALRQGDVAVARRCTSNMVSRDTSHMDEQAMLKATVESVLENGCDAVFGALFWFLVAGAPGVVAYRLINTLDAMWGYRNPRFLNFGFCAAKLDDGLNFIPARLTAVTYYCVSRWRFSWKWSWKWSLKQGWSQWFDQIRSWDSPNGAWVIGAGASALGVTLGGAAQYGGKLKWRPEVGGQNPVTMNHVQEALVLVYKSMALWLLLVALGESLIG